MASNKRWITIEVSDLVTWAEESDTSFYDKNDCKIHLGDTVTYYSKHQKKTIEAIVSGFSIETKLVRSKGKPNIIKSLKRLMVDSEGRFNMDVSSSIYNMKHVTVKT